MNRINEKTYGETKTCGEQQQKTTAEMSFLEVSGKAESPLLRVGDA